MFNKIIYLMILIITFIFTYIFDVSESYLFFYMILLMPFIDYILYLFYRNKLECRIWVNYEYIEKNKDIFVEIEFINKGILPIPFYTYEVNLEKDFTSEEELLGCESIKGKSSSISRINIRPIHIGSSKILIDYIEIRSLFGIFSRRIKGIIDEAELIVIPSIYEINNIDSIINSSYIEDENSMVKGELGSEYKEYNNGESLGKINWKLYSKHRKLYVRKEEGISKGEIIFLLDPYISNNNDMDYLLEGILSLIREVLLIEDRVKLLLNEKNNWIRVNIQGEEDIKNLQRKLASYRFTNKRERLQGVKINENIKGDFIILTVSKDNAIIDFSKELIRNSINVNLISYSKTRVINEEFYLNKHYKLERI